MRHVVLVVCDHQTQALQVQAALVKIVTATGADSAHNVAEPVKA